MEDGRVVESGDWSACNVLQRFLSFPRACLSAVRVAKRTHSLTAARLRWLSRRRRSKGSGYFRFTFGRVHYVDALDLESIFADIFLSKVYQLSTLPERPYIIDCGGNIGLSAIWFKLHYPQASITVFEADSSLAKILSENVNSIALNDVEVVGAAVTDRNGPIPFARKGSLTGHVTSSPGMVVEGIRLSDRLNKAVDLLKINIEGSEFCLLRDLCATGIINLIRHLICEIHGSSRIQSQIHRLLKELCDCGFALTVAGAVMHPDLPGPPDPTPFTYVKSGKFTLWLYAWR
jgi:FkbM family methyltransferase